MLEDFDDEMHLLQTRLHTALQKLSVAKCLPNATRCVPTSQARYGVRLWCLLHASLAGERWLSDSASVRENLVAAYVMKTELWSRVSHTLYRISPPVPPMWARQFMILTLDTMCV